MRVVLQTVKNASVKIDNKLISSINKGYLLLVGFCDGDDKNTCDLLADKIVKLRCFSDEHGLINLSLNDVNGDILSVSQFTLYADVKKGRRPSFIDALKPSQAQPLYEYFNNKLESILNKNISSGIFGANMEVYSNNDGPFTLILDSKELWQK